MKTGEATRPHPPPQRSVNHDCNIFSLEYLADFGALYGSLGALMALLLFVYAAANVLVFGAEFASEWARLPADAEVHERVAHGRRRVRGLLRRS